MAKKSKLRSIISDIENTIQVASQNFDIWWNLKVDKNRREFVDVMNFYLGYFDVAIHAHFAATIFALYRIMETRNDTHNFYELVKCIENRARLKAKFIPDVRQKLAAMKPTWIKIGILRNEAFGHSSQAGFSAAFAKAKLTPNHLKEFIQSAKELINIISHKTTRSSYAFNLSSERVTIELLSDLKKLKDTSHTDELARN